MTQVHLAWSVVKTMLENLLSITATNQPL